MTNMLDLISWHISYNYHSCKIHNGVTIWSVENVVQGCDQGCMGEEIGVQT
jgi:hypothetical protein